MPRKPQVIDMVLDIPTHMVITENARISPFVRAAAFKALRGIASNHASQYLEKHPDFTPLKHYTARFEVLGMGGGTHLDPANYAPVLKPILDGFTGRWWEDDDAKHLVETTFAYGGVWKNPPRALTRYRRFHLTITEVDPTGYITKAVERPELEEIAEQWQIDPNHKIPIVPQDGKTDPNDGVTQYYKLIAREERKAEAKKAKTAAAKLLPTAEQEPDYPLEVHIPSPDDPTPEPIELKW